MRAAGKVAAGAGVDERIVRTRLGGKLFHDAGCTWMGCQQHVALQRADLVDAGFEQGRDIGSALASRETVIAQGHCRHTVCVHDVEASGAVAGLPGPGGAAGCMAGRHVCGDRHGAGLEHLAFTDRLHLRDLGEMIGLHRRVLRIVLADGAVPEDLGAMGAGRNDRAAGALQRRDAAGVVDVRVGIKDQLDVLDPEAQLPDVFFDEWRRFGYGAVEQNVALRAGDEDRGQLFGADVPGIAEDIEGLLGVVPGGKCGCATCQYGSQRQRRHLCHVVCLPIFSRHYRQNEKASRGAFQKDANSPRMIQSQITSNNDGDGCGSASVATKAI